MSNKVDLSIIIVHTFEAKMIRQTLKGIRSAAPRLKYEIIIVDNDPSSEMKNILDNEFLEVKYIANKKNIGFGSAMNVGIKQSQGRYVLIFNPDIIVLPKSLERMCEFMDNNHDIGMCGPKLTYPDGTLQFSCYRQPTKFLPVYRRTPLGKTRKGKEVVDDFLMVNEDHDENMEVDSLIGASLFTRREDLFEVGLFDENFFMYYEDNDLCRRFWEKGKKVVYYPDAKMIHYHRRASADGSLVAQLMSKFTWIHINSFIKYYRKYKNKKNPRKEFYKQHGGN